MRKRISEQNIFPNFDLYTEYRKIDNLLSEEKLIDNYNRLGRRVYNYMTLEEYIQSVCFNDWNLSGTFVSIDEMRQALGIERGSITIDNIDENRVLDFLQYAINCVYRVSMTIKASKVFLLSDDTIIKVLWDNIKLLTEKLNCTLELDKKSQEIFILYSNSTAGAVSKDYPNAEESISEYLRIDNRQDIKRKSEILCTLYKELERIEPKLKANNFSSIISDTTFLFDKAGIRHWGGNNKISCATFLKMDEKELEEWYDKIFNMFLTCMVLAKYVDNIPDIKSIKKSVE